MIKLLTSDPQQLIRHLSIVYKETADSY